MSEGRVTDSVGLPVGFGEASVGSVTVSPEFPGGVEAVWTEAAVGVSPNVRGTTTVWPNDAWSSWTAVDFVGLGIDGEVDGACRAVIRASHHREALR